MKRVSSWGRRPTPRHVRLAVLERDGWRCQLGYPGCTYHAVEVDHIASTTQTGVSREQVDADGCQAVCANCHHTKTEAEKRAGIKASHARRATRKRLPKSAKHPGEW